MVTPIVSLSFESRYDQNDPNLATIDPERESAALDALAPLDAFIMDLSRQAAGLYEGRTPERRQAADCIVSSLGNWARADALSDIGTDTVNLTLGSRLASFTLFFWQASPYTRSHPDRETVIAWLERRILSQIGFWETAPPGARRGNLRAWAALSGAALSLVSEREDFTPWAEEALTDILCSAAADGSLPQEMKRGELAFHYQLHAVAPIVTTAAILERKGIAIQDICDGALHRIAAFTLGDVGGAQQSESIAGVPQKLLESGDQLQGFRLAWVEAYLHFVDAPEIDELVERLRPLHYSKLGGNQTALWGR